MTIDGIDISIYGLTFSKIDNFYSLPARKNTLKEPGFEAKDIVFKQKKPTITLLGQYEYNSSLMANIENFKTMIKSAVSHLFYIDGHELTFTGVITKGIKITPVQNIAIVEFTVNIVE